MHLFLKKMEKIFQLIKIYQKAGKYKNSSDGTH